MDVLVVATPLRVLCEIALSSIWNISTTLNAWQFCLAKIRQDSLGFTAVIGHTARLRMKAPGKRLFVLCAGSLRQVPERVMRAWIS